MSVLRLKELRDKRKLTQQEVANHLKLSSDAYSLYELGKRQMNYQTLNLLADMFNVSIDYLLGRDDNNLVKLNEDEAELINKYRRCDKRGQMSVKTVLNHECSQQHSSIKKSAI